MSSDESRAAAWRTPDQVTHVAWLDIAGWELLCNDSVIEDPFNAGWELPGSWRFHTITCIACIAQLARNNIL